MKWKSSRNASAQAHNLLPKMAEKYFRAGRKATDGKRSPKDLHRFRIATKRFRYTLELFRPVYGPSLERQMRPLRELQSMLGKLSDYHSILALLEGDKALEAKINQASTKKLKEFHRHWKQFDSDGQLTRWQTYLGGKGRTSSGDRSLSPGQRPTNR